MTGKQWSKALCVHLVWVTALLAVLVSASPLHAQDEDFDQYKVRISGFWFYSKPSVTITGAGRNGFVDFSRDFGFNTYSTFSGKFDWKFTRKNHFYVAAAPFNQSRQVVLNRTVSFQGQTFTVGSIVKGDLQALLIAPGYQYDIIRRKRGHLGVAMQIDVFNTTASLNAAAQVVGGVPRAPVSAEASLLAPIPVAGPEFRLYLTNSPRLFVEGNVYGMYFFGYGNFVSSSGTLGLTLSKHLSVNGGYQLGSRLTVNNNASDRIGLNLTQKGAIAGLEISF